MIADAFVASSKPKVELDSHADMCVVSDNCFDLHRPVNFYNYDPKDDQRGIKTADAALGCQDLNDKSSYLH